MAFEIAIHKCSESKISTFDPQDIGFGKVFTDHMFKADWDGQQWTQLQICPYEPLTLSPATSALHYGQAIFEGMKAFKYGSEVRLFRPLNNAQRLNLSARRMVMPEVPEEMFMKALHTLVEIEQQWVPEAAGSSLYIRPFMFATDDFVGVRPSNKYTFIIFCCPVGPYYDKPLKVKIEQEYSRAAPGGTGFAKCAGNYGGSMFPTRKAQEEGYDQVLWTDPVEHKYVEETGTTNFFCRIGDQIVTPLTDGNLLDGITRDSIITILRHQGIEVIEKHLSIAELIEAYEKGQLKEMFVTGTAATLINIEGFGYKGKYFEVLKNGDTQFSKQAKNFLDQMRSGNGEDPFGWIELVQDQDIVLA